MAARFPNCCTKLKPPSSSSPTSPPPPPPSTAVSALPAINSHSLTPFPSACNSSSLPKLNPLYTHHHYHSHIHVNQQNRRIRCKAVLLHDAPFAGAIGACVLNSLTSPPPVGPNDNEDDDSMINSSDARFAVMGIISFIPYFNWMSWVFALMDTGDKRYAAYAIVYLAPYIRSNLSLLPDESWLPIASILVGILHVQLEASIKNGDIKNFPLFNRKREAKVSEQETSKDELRSKSRDTKRVKHLDEDGEEGKKQ
ncbi:hypothetical protein HanRHA438_Chr17g0790851 [Helianthus annuus]|uniref:Uncharacterized protein n=1 Tax=Helianthus annuus TaxID=4232 RepID=A0A251RL69_HELAN|nr:uncharacterized protein LOC110922399 [Helianthus annuus]KAF5753452.1 hypothetical protein HanXRQr2_Chr17g0780291 [Helianthus annuus]KAJ0427536.1 hypothetical protein HanHA300_Chr17g0636311 [Helianthus annuus]KAJ0431345.1 hypothetical protein HanIR_Chr17g0847381 [Helianthus annuus]KAJ0445816.1 hypothetical protein HanHA89_Chr17g0687571 [Helianthus annuus]KAJ0630785.1 hypothetical protein HanLR1_Chr17g0647011 [Helianthus annuus]